MHYQVLARKWRPQTFEEVVGQEPIARTLQNALAQGRIAHAFLFSGPRGTGKTSTARILAKALNCPNVSDDGEPCCQCESCVAIETGKSFDVHELDAASNNKVDDIRDLISKVHLGSPGNTKVYILDEVHMLSAGAENALLKTLEEPPPHVIFVLATTEPHKVVQTIRSRTQPFEFHLLPADELTEHVRFVIADAELDIPDDELEGVIDYVVRQGGGSVRDTLSALDLVAAGGIPAGSDVGHDLASAIGEHSPEAAIAALQTGLTNGQEPRVIGEATVEMLRDAFLALMGASIDHLNDTARDRARELGAKLGAATLTRSLEAIGTALVDMRQAPDPRVPLEVTLLQLCRRPEAATKPGSEPTDAAGGTGVVATDHDRVDALSSRIAALEETVAALSAQLAGEAAGKESSAGGGPAPADGARSRLAEAAGNTEVRAGAKAPRSPRSRRPGSSAPQAKTADTAPANGSEDRPEPATADGSEDRPQPQPSDGSENRPQPQPADGSGDRPQPQPADGRPFTAGDVTRLLETGLDGVSQRARVRFQVGRVDSVQGSTVFFAVPNQHYVDRCRSVQSEIEEVLSSRFGPAVDLQVVVDDAGPPTSLDPAKIEPASDKPRDDSIDDVGPVDELADASDQSFDGVERLTKAFPGSKVIEPNPE
jgi:DNA polymerase-3 subunit gamma/tau